MRKHKHFTREQLTYRCTECGGIISKGTSKSKYAVSHGLHQACVPKFMQGITVTIEEPEQVATNE